MPLNIREGYWNQLYAYATSDPLGVSDSLGLDAIWDFVANNLGKKLQSKLQNAGIAGLLAAGCIADNCARKVTTRDQLGAYADCMSVMNRLGKGQAGIPILGDPANYISACADICVNELAKLSD